MMADATGSLFCNCDPRATKWLPRRIMMQLGQAKSAPTTGTLEDLVDRQEAARLLGVVPRTLDRWHLAQTGPPRVLIGRKVRYRRQTLEQWVCETERP